jgi:hypothetical protein
MRGLSIILIVVGAICLLVPSFTFFTQERVADVGFFAIDVKKPHTVILNPGVGIALLAVGGIMFMMADRRGSAA